VFEIGGDFQMRGDGVERRRREIADGHEVRRVSRYSHGITVT
jgi:hypothetical protein